MCIEFEILNFEPFLSIKLFVPQCLKTDGVTTYTVVCLLGFFKNKFD